MTERSAAPAAILLWASTVRERGTLVAVIVAAAGLSLLPGLASWLSEGDIEPVQLLSDPAEEAGISWFVGAVHDLNLLLWGAACAMLLVAAAGSWRKERRLARGLGLLGALTVVLTLDDRFLLHEIVVPWLFGLGEEVTFAGYAAALLAILLTHRRALLGRPEASILLLALMAFGTSVVLDLSELNLAARGQLEETAKLLGTVAWLAYPSRIVIRSMSRSPAAHCCS